jgi:hypothetical protein
MRTTRKIERARRHRVAPLLLFSLSVPALAADPPVATPSPPETRADAPPALALGPPLELLGRYGDRQERALTWSFVGLSAIDAWQTARRPQDVAEANPLLGDDPSPVQAVAFKSAVTWGVVSLTRRVPSGPRRKTVLWILNAVQLAVIVHNEEVSAGIVF